MVSQDAPYLGSSFCHVSLGPASHPARKGEQVPLEELRPVGAHRLVLCALGAGAAHLSCFPLPAPRGQSSPCFPHLEVLVLTSLPSALWCQGALGLPATLHVSWSQDRLGGSAFHTGTGFGGLRLTEDGDAQELPAWFSGPESRPTAASHTG